MSGLTTTAAAKILGLDMGIYAIENLANGKYYIGSAVSIPQRFADHKWRLQGGIHHSARLQNAWNKYGQEVFRFYCLEPVEQAEELVKREQMWISEFRSSDRRFGYNISPTAGSQLGLRFTEEAKARMVAMQKKRLEEAAYRVKMLDALKKGASPASRIKANDSMKKRWQDPEYRARIVEAQKKRYDSPAARIKASESQKKRYENQTARIQTSESNKKRYEDEAERIKTSDAMRKSFAHPASRIKLSEAQHKRYRDPASRIKLSEAQKKRYADPAERAKTSAAIKKGWTKRRAA